MKRLSMLTLLVVVGAMLSGFAGSQKGVGREEGMEMRQRLRAPQVQPDMHNNEMPAVKKKRLIKRVLNNEPDQRLGEIPYVLKRPKNGDPAALDDGNASKPVKFPAEKAVYYRFIHKERNAADGKEVKKDPIRQPGTLRTPERTPLDIRNPVVRPVDDGDLGGDDPGAGSGNGPDGFASGDKNAVRRDPAKEPGSLRTPTRKPQQVVRDPLVRPGDDGDLTGESDSYSPHTPGVSPCSDGNNGKMWHPAKNPGMLRTPVKTPVDTLRPGWPAPSRDF